MYQDEIRGLHWAVSGELDPQVPLGSARPAIGEVHSQTSSDRRQSALQNVGEYVCRRWKSSRYQPIVHSPKGGVVQASLRETARNNGHVARMTCFGLLRHAHTSDRGCRSVQCARRRARRLSPWEFFWIADATPTCCIRVPVVLETLTLRACTARARIDTLMHGSGDCA